jgi:hypothetical protein
MDLREGNSEKVMIAIGGYTGQMNFKPKKESLSRNHNNWAR